MSSKGDFVWFSLNPSACSRCSYVFKPPSSGTCNVPGTSTPQPALREIFRLKVPSQFCEPSFRNNCTLVNFPAKNFSRTCLKITKSKGESDLYSFSKVKRQWLSACALMSLRGIFSIWWKCVLEIAKISKGELDEGALTSTGAGGAWLS